MSKTKLIFILLSYFLVFIIAQQYYVNTRIPTKLPDYKPPNNLLKYDYDMRYFRAKRYIENPDIRTCFGSGHGLLGDLIIAFRFPGHLLQGLVEASIFWVSLSIFISVEYLINRFGKRLKFKIYLVYPIMIIRYGLVIHVDYAYFDMPVATGFYYYVWILIFCVIPASLQNLKKVCGGVFLGGAAGLTAQPISGV